MGLAALRSVQRIALVLGTLEALGAALWCMGGAGIYGSPLPGMPAEELLLVWAFLLTGPFSTTAGAILGRFEPRWGAGWLIGGGLVSGCIALTFLPTDAGVFPLLLTSVPMLGVGAWLWSARRGCEPSAARSTLSASQLEEFRQETDGPNFFRTQPDDAPDEGSVQR